MQQPTQPTAFTFNSARQQVIQFQAALAHTVVTRDERDDSF